MVVRRLRKFLKSKLQRYPAAFRFYQAISWLTRSPIAPKRFLPKFVDTAFPMWLAPRVRLAYSLITAMDYLDGKLDKAVAIADDVLARKPQAYLSEEVLSRLAWIYYSAGRREQANRLSERLADRRWQVARQFQYDRLNLRFFPKRYFWSIGDLGVLDTYFKSQILGLTRRCTNLILGAPEEFSNPAYVRYWQKYYSAITNPRTISTLAPLSDFLQESRTMVRLSTGFQSFADFGPAVQLRWEAEGRGPLLELTAEHRERGYRLLRELGVPDGAWFAGLHVRDAKDQIPLIRNADIITYRLAIEAIAKRGGWVLRMGDSSMRPLPPWPNAIDYAHSGKRTDWMDVFLWAEGRFFIGTGSGPQMIPMTFGKPVAIANFGPIATILCGKNDILLPKQYWSEKEGRYLTIAERVAPDHGNREHVEIFTGLGIHIIDNTLEELRELVIEMMDRLDGRHVATEQEEILQARFAQAAAAERVYPVKIARAFMSRYPDLFQPTM